MDLFLNLALGIDPALHDLNAVEVAAVGVLQCGHEEGRRLAVRCGAQVAPHRHALGIARLGRHPGLRVGIGEIPPAEEAHGDARAGGRIGFLALQRVPDRLAGVFGRPDPGVTCGGHLPTDDVDLRRGDHRVLPAVRVRLDARVLAEKVVLLGCREAGMRVGAADEAELERVDAKFCLKFQPFLQRAPRILAFDHSGRLRHARQIGGIPFLEPREFIGG